MIHIDNKNFQVFVDGKEIFLTPVEFELLVLLAKRPGVPYHREKLIASIWGYRKDSVTDSTIYNAVYKLRSKIGKDRIINRNNVGYLLKLE